MRSLISSQSICSRYIVCIILSSFWTILQSFAFHRNVESFRSIAVFCRFSVCSEDIGMVVLELLEKGELQKMHKKWWYDKGECVAEDPKVSGRERCWIEK
jgi:hypothetical protein